MANEPDTQEERIRKSNVSLDQLYNTMAQEADGFYKQMITISTAFLGGTLAYFDKLFVGNVRWSLWLLFPGWALLVFPIAVLALVRWQNVEAHRHVLEYFKTGDEKEYATAARIGKKGRWRTKCAIYSMILGLALMAAFTAANIFFSQRSSL